MKKYKIPISWMCETIIEIEAEDKETAMKKLEEDFYSEKSLPTGKYVQDSLDIDPERITVNP